MTVKDLIIELIDIADMEDEVVIEDKNCDYLYVDGVTKDRVLDRVWLEVE